MEIRFVKTIRYYDPQEAINIVCFHGVGGRFPKQISLNIIRIKIKNLEEIYPFNKKKKAKVLETMQPAGGLLQLIEIRLKF